MLAACSAPQAPAPALAERGSKLPPHYTSPDRTLTVRFRLKDQGSYYEIADRIGEMPPVRAQSAITPADFLKDGRYPRTVDVVFASDGSGVVITEDNSDASFAFRHIHVARADGKLRVRYLQPPQRKFLREPGWVAKAPPRAIALTADTITLYYPQSAFTTTVPLASIKSADRPED